jgi:hypothetical protein
MIYIHIYYLLSCESKRKPICELLSKWFIENFVISKSKFDQVVSESLKSIGTHK